MKRDRTHRWRSSSSSEDEALIVYKKDKNSYHSLHEDHQEQCEFCDEVFKNRYTLYQHNITHMIIPLIKKTDYRCTVCKHRSTSAANLESHMLKYHNKVILNPERKNDKDIMADILKGIIEKQVLVKCQDDISVLINKRQNGKIDSMIHDVTEPRKDNILNDMTHRNAKRDSIINNTDSSKLQSEVNDNGLIKTDIKILEKTKLKKSNILKEEPLNPTLVKDRSSSPIDDDKEPIRHRLLFEEDIEDSLFKDISDECNMNIETLCQEVSFDFDDAISVSDSDDAMSVGTYERLRATNNHANGMNKFETGINKYDGMNNYETFVNVIDTSKKTVNNYENGINKYDGMNNFETVVDVIETPKNGGYFESAMNDFNNGMNNFNGNTSNGFDVSVFSHVAKVKDTTELENDTDDIFLGKAIHFDTLMVPDVCVCRFCHKEFPHRFPLIQHEADHLKVKKKNCFHVPLCCLCERYIAGNYRSLKSHMEREHPGRSNNYQINRCTKCDLKYCNYNKHLEHYHQIYECAKCKTVFDTLQQKDGHECKENTLNRLKNPDNADVFVTFMQLCDLCFSFMKIYMRNRQNYEEIGTKTEMGVRQTCDKCNKRFFSVKLVKRFSLRPVTLSIDGRKASGASQKVSNIGQMALDGLKASELSRNSSDVGQKTTGFGSKQSDIARRATEYMNRNKMRSVKPMTNEERLMKIRNRLKMLKMINK